MLTKIVPQQDGGLSLDRLMQRIDKRTRVIALSAVMFATGFRNDLQAVGQICRERGIYFVVDGIQALGALPIDVQACNIDVLATGSQKWLMAAPGSGFLYMRQELIDDLQPGGVCRHLKHGRFRELPRLQFHAAARRPTLQPRGRPTG